MTIEEAIERLEGRYMNVSMCGTSEKAMVENEAINMAITALRAQQEAEKNEPLTLEELKAMCGKPVWVQPPKDPIYGRWAIVDGVDVARNKLFLVSDFTCHDYGTVWIAYRKEQEAPND